MSTPALVRSTVSAFTVLASLVIGQNLVQAVEPVENGKLAAQTGDRGQQFNERLEALRKAVGVHRRNVGRLRRLRGVVASGTGLDPDGRAVIRVFVERGGVSGIPALLEDIRVRTQVSGRFYARRGQTCESAGDGVCENTERWPLPVPIGVSVGHPAVSAGTIGARLTDGANFFILSNNHVLAATNQASLGDSILQPGAIDSGLDPDDAIASLSDFEPITLCEPLFWFWFLVGQDCSSSENSVDAAIALTTQGELGFATPEGEHDSIAGYGAPRSRFHPAYDDGELSDLLGVTVKKYGSRTALTTGTVTTIDATVEVCYDPDCVTAAAFVDQVIITANNFSAGGDSGSLIVDSANRPVGLLFAGSDTNTVANRIDRVMQRFAGKTIDVGGSDGTSLTTGPMLALRQVMASTALWTTVTLDQDYGNDMVVVCTPNYDVSGLGPTVVRIRNAVGSSFEVGLARPWFEAVSADVWSTNVHCMIVRAGVYSEGEHGATMEAVKLTNITTTDNFGSWVGEPQGYANAYNAPVVVGQVMSAAGGVPGEIGDWSVFWARGTSRRQPPSASTLYVGRHTGEDPTGRSPETLGYVVIEQGSGNIDNIAYASGLGADSVRGVSNSPPYIYGLSGVPTPSTGILSQAGMDGANGSWPILYGASALSPDAFNVAIDEDWYRDSERSHTNEQVGYIVFD